MADSGSGHRVGGPYFTVDVHLHTNRGSSDSNLAPKDLISRAKEIGIGAVCITEHDTMWEFREMPELLDDHGPRFLRGMEVTTDMGHIGVFGLSRYVGGIYKLAELRKVVDAEGGILIANHPFRYKLDPRFSFINPDHEPIDENFPERAAKLPIFTMVDAIEVLNGACSEDENIFALKVARLLGKAEVAGSDSHSAGSIGCVTTLFADAVVDERNLIDQIKARRTCAGRGLMKGNVVPFEII